MDNATKFHNDFEKDLVNLINKFHEEHPDLFIVCIDLDTAKTMLREFIYRNPIKVDIMVQPRIAKEPPNLLS